MKAPKDVNEELESDSPRWCELCERWDDDCRCPEPLDPIDEQNELECDDLELDKVEATTQWFDELSARGNNAGGEDVCLPALSPAPLLQLDYPAWRLSFSAYAEHLGLEVPA